MSADRSDLRAEQVEALAHAWCAAGEHAWVAETPCRECRATAIVAAPTVAALLADATAEAERQRDAVVAAVEGDPLVALVINYLRCYTLPANYGAPLYGQTHDDVAENCGPLIAEVVREHIDAALAAARPAERERGGA